MSVQYRINYLSEFKQRVISLAGGKIMFTGLCSLHIRAHTREITLHSYYMLISVLFAVINVLELCTRIRTINFNCNIPQLLFTYVHHLEITWTVCAFMRNEGITIIRKYRSTQEEYIAFLQLVDNTYRCRVLFFPILLASSPLDFNFHPALYRHFLSMER